VRGEDGGGGGVGGRDWVTACLRARSIVEGSVASALSSVSTFELSSDDRVCVCVRVCVRERDCVMHMLSPVCLDLICLLLVLLVRACVCRRETVCVAAALCSVCLYVICLLLFLSACMCVCVRVCVCAC